MKTEAIPRMPTTKDPRREVKTIYICSPYRAITQEEAERNINYARELTRKVLRAGGIPITPHLYITQCLDDNILEERQQGLAAGIELLFKCDCVLLGAKYGISQGMNSEIKAAEKNGIKIVNAKRLEELK